MANPYDEYSRAEYLAWAKERALECLERGELTEAVASMTSDLQKHSETREHFGIMLGVLSAVGGHMRTPEQVRHWIEGFN